MLGTRIVTALVLLAIVVAALAATSPWPFMLPIAALAAAAAWEWLRLGEVAMPFAWAGGALAAGIVIVLAEARPVAPAALWGLVGALWLTLGSLALRAGPAGWSRLPRALRLGVGLALVVAGAWAMLVARQRGLAFLLSVFCLVWMADIAAYFGGRAIGRRKLAPTISPGKTWEGALTGALAVLAMGVAWVLAEAPWQTGPAGASLYAQLWRALGWPGLVLALLALVALAVMGDLFESLVKRASGVKDSSRLLPGHGGVLDRIDALLPVFPAALALTTAVA